jgi:hypothetical protein
MYILANTEIVTDVAQLMTPNSAVSQYIHAWTSITLKFVSS